MGLMERDLASTSDYLLEEFHLRSAKRTRYSIRAMARDLKLSAPFLSQVMGGKRRLSVDKAFKVAKLLNWSERRTAEFLRLVQLEQTTDPDLKTKLESQAKGRTRAPSQARVRHFSMDHLESLSGWEHLAILELSQVDGFRNDARWIARKLALRPEAVEAALERLRRLGMIRQQNGIWRKTDPHLATVHDVPSRTTRRFHSKVLARARVALREEPVENREFLALLVPADPALIREFKEAMRRFHQEFMEKAEATSSKALYLMGMQLFRLDQDSNHRRTRK